MACAAELKEFVITDDDIASYHERGFLHIRQALSSEHVAKLKAQAKEWERTVKVVPPHFKLTKPGSASEFIPSVRGIIGFGSPGAVQQIGHGLHLLSEPFREIAYSDSVYRALRSLGVERPHIVQSKLVVKPPKHGAVVPVHADNGYIYSERPEHGATVYYVFEESTTQNGCLEVAVGSHARGLKFPLRYECDHARKCARLVLLKDDPSKLWQQSQMNELSWEPIEMGAGDLLILHPGLLHKSAKNTSNSGRCAYVCHLTDGRFPFAKTNWAQPPEGERFQDFPQYALENKDRDV